MLRLAPLLLVGCGFELTPGSAVIDGAPGDGPRDGAGDSSIDARMLDAPPDAFVNTPLCNASDSNLRACFLFEAGLADGSSYTNTATGTSSAFQTGHLGLGLNASASNIHVPNHPSLSLSRMTLRMWIKPAAHPPGALRMGLIENDTFRFFTLSGGRLRCAINDGTIVVNTTMTVPLNVWSRVACTYDQARLVIYIDGVERGMVVAAGTLAPAITEMTIGHQQPSGEVFDGMMDEVMVYNAIVSP